MLELPITKAFRLSRIGPQEAGIRLACRVILEHDEEVTPPDTGCLECSLGTVPKHLETGPCLYHQACELLREVGLEP